MKRFGNLFEPVTGYGNLTKAFRLALKGCGPTSAACRFFFHLEPELLRLQKELRTGAYRPGPYRTFKIRDPKARVISVAPFRERVVHHAVVGVLTPIYERTFIHDSYATRKGKGTHKAVLRAQKFLRRKQWYLKLDVDQYFASIDRNVLLELLARKIKDGALLELLDRIIRNPVDAAKGLPIGNLTSQFFANVYLDPLDHLIKDQMGVREYVRYMDDMILFGESGKTLKMWLASVESFLHKGLHLRLKESATCLQHRRHGLSFLGMRIFPALIRIRSENRIRSCRRLGKKVKEWKWGRIDEEEMARSVESVMAHLRYFSPNARILLGDRFEKPAGPTG